MTYTKVPSAASASPASPNNVPSASATAPNSTNYTPVPVGVATPPLDALSSAPRAAYSMRRRLLSSYSGALYRVRKTTGGDTVTEHDVPYVAATGLADATDLAAFVGSESWAVTKIYDQTSGARDISQATGANQPTGGTTGTPVTLSSQPAADYDTNDRLTRADALGLSGAVAISIWADISVDTAAAERNFASIGTNAAGAYISVAYPTATSLKIGINGGNRVFTASSLTSGRHRIIARLGAGAQVGTSRIQQNGSELSELSSTNPTNTMTLGTAGTFVGCEPSALSFHDGKVSECVFWNADLSAGDLAIINGLS